MDGDRSHQQRWDVVGVGENSIDDVYRVPALPIAHAKMPILSRRRTAGGQVATTLCTCAKLGLRTAYVGTFGNDENGRLIRATLESYAVDTTYTQTREAPNRHALILLDDRTGDRTVYWQRDRALALGASDIPADLIGRARVVHVDATDEDAALAAARLAREAGAQVTTDIDTVTTRTPQLMAAATFPIFAGTALQALTGQSDPEHALRRLRERHDGPLCVTLGEGGALLLVADRLHHAPAFAIEALDTTGAGDVFRGALIYSLLRGDDPDTMLRFASAAAAISCTRQGAIGGTPSLAEAEALLIARSTLE